jgi:GT2 family glycosyltransferase
VIYAITLCFNRPDIIRESLEAFYRTKNPSTQIKHILVDQHYPLPDKKSVHFQIYRMAQEFGCVYLNPGRNLGLHKGFNWACKEMKMTADDIVIGYDGDSNPISPGWDMALVTALSNPDIAWSSLMNPRSKKELLERGYDEITVGGHLKVWITKNAVVNSVCAWRYSFLQASGGLQEPSEYYGHLESTMWQYLIKQKKKWAFTPGWEENDYKRNQADWQFTHYKWCYAHLKSWTGDFDSYLAAGCPNPEGAPKHLP